MRTTDAMREVLARPIAKVPALRGRQVTILFYEASTRTRVSLRGRGQEPLGGRRQHRRGVVVGVEGRVARRHGPDRRGARRPDARDPPQRVRGAVPRGRDLRRLRAQRRRRLARPPDAGAARPLHDAVAHCGDASLAGRKVVILGDVLHSRVARSNIWTLTAAGADLWLCGPATLLRGFEAWAGRGAAAGRRFHVTTSIDEALRDADVVMALRIQRERMASGLLPSLREYAARYGLTAARLRSREARGAGHASRPDERGRRDRRRRGRRAAVGHHRPGHERGRGPDGAALPAGRRAATGRAAARRRVDRPRDQPGLARRPGRGSRGPRRDRRRATGSSRPSTWLEGAEADGIDDRGVVVAPGFIDLHAHLREPGNEDAETIASGLAAAAHGGFTTVCAMPNTTPALDEPGVLARIRAAGGRERVAGRAARPRRRDGRPGRARRWPPSASWPTRASSGSATTARRSRPASILRIGAGLRGRARPADRRPPRGRRR